MKKLLIPLFVFSLTGCASKPEPKPQVEAFLKLNDAHKEKHVSCTEQNKVIFSKAITEKMDPEKGETEYVFVRDEKKALSYLKQVDLKKLIMRENELEYDALVDDCEVSDVERPVCDTIWPAMRFYKGLASATQNYKWKSQTKKLAQEQILKYITHVGESRPTLTNIQVGVDLLRQIATKTSKSDTEALKKEVDQVQAALQARRRIAAARNLGCEEYKSLHTVERQAIDQFSAKLLDLSQTLYSHSNK